MIRQSSFACVAVSLGLSLACNERPDIEAKTQKLTEARNNAPEVVKDLEAQLQTAKAEVIELEKKLALAREGVTDDVLRERQQLEGALDAQRQNVQKEVNEARRESQVLDKNADRAMQQLKETQPPAQVETRVKTQTGVVRGNQQQVEAPTRDEIVPVRGGPEEQPSQKPGEVKSTTTTTPAEPTAPHDPDKHDPDKHDPDKKAPENNSTPPAPGIPAPENDEPTR